MYRNWASHLPPAVEVVSIELPGRGARMKEPPIVSLPALIESVVEDVLPLLNVPFVFFGHSMGAVIAFELTRRLRRQINCEPQALFVAGRRAPQIPDEPRVAYNSPEDEFIEELYRMDGTPREVLENAELMDLMIPLLRADFQLVQTYEYSIDEPLQCPIIAYGGLDDIEETRDKLLCWKEHTVSAFKLHMLPGDHFFLRSSQATLLGLLADELNRVIARLQNSKTELDLSIPGL
jgi:surfactin synthase thioesterase subunit